MMKATPDSYNMRRNKHRQATMLWQGLAIRVDAVHGNRYRAEITANGVTHYLGTWPLTEDGFQKAKAARLLAEDIYWGGSE